MVATLGSNILTYKDEVVGGASNNYTEVCFNTLNPYNSVGVDSKRAGTRQIELTGAWGRQLVYSATRNMIYQNSCSLNVTVNVGQKIC